MTGYEENPATPSDPGIQAVIRAINETFRTGTVPADLPLLPDEETREELAVLLADLAATQEFGQSLARGDLSRDLAVKGRTAGCLKALQSNLRHLTWQVGQVAEGDLTQHVDFMGEFSASFAAMMEALQKARAGRDQEEMALKEREKRYRDMFEVNNAVMFLVDPETRQIVDANAAACRYYGYTLEEMQHLLITQINIQDPKKTSESMRQATKSPGAVFQFRHKKKDGGIRDVRVFSGTIFFGGRRLLHSIVQDVTEEMRAVSALAESEKRYRDLVENLSEVIVSLDLSGKFTYVSPVGYRLYGYPAETLVGEQFLKFVHPDDQARVAGIFGQELSGSYLADEFRILVPDGSTRWISVSPRPLEQGGRITSFNYVLADITDRKKMEDALQQTNRKLNLLSSITRHDIKNQLLGLTTYLELSKNYLHDTARLAEYIAREEKAANAIGRQIEFTKEYENLGITAPVWQSAAASVKDALPDLPVGKLTIRVDLGKVEIYADPLLGKVFYNLIDNALRYGGQKMTAIDISGKETGTGLVIRVEDNGDGISSADKQRLFERGFGHNTGLGLFLSREILSITGISITETGEPGKGARFEIAVPEGGYRYGDAH
jgi:PAS domain S-box-containing protein